MVQLAHMTVQFLIFWETFRLTSTVGASVYIPTGSEYVFLLHIPISTGCQFWMTAILTRMKCHLKVAEFAFPWGRGMINTSKSTCGPFAFLLWGTACSFHQLEIFKLLLCNQNLQARHGGTHLWSQYWRGGGVKLKVQGQAELYHKTLSQGVREEYFGVFHNNLCGVHLRPINVPCIPTGVLILYLFPSQI